MSITKSDFLHRSSSQNHEGLQSFYSNLDLLFSNMNHQHPAYSIVRGHFNAKCSKWCTTNKNNTTGLKLDSIKATAEYNQRINKQMHLVNESSICIYLIFFLNASFVKKTGEVNYWSFRYVTIISSIQP